MRQGNGVVYRRMLIFGKNLAEEESRGETSRDRGSFKRRSHAVVFVQNARPPQSRNQEKHPRAATLRKVSALKNSKLFQEKRASLYKKDPEVERSEGLISQGQGSLKDWEELVDETLRLGKFDHLRSCRLRITCRDRWLEFGLSGFGARLIAVWLGRDGTRLREDGAPL